ncbi:MAG: hypothetical protein ACK53I_07270, partial [Phenylobacterium sp.]
MGSRSRLMFAAGACALATAAPISVAQTQTRPRPAAPAAQPVQRVTPPIAVSWMSAQTQTGFGMPSMGGGGGPDIGAMMRGMMGGGGPVKSLMLQLGSSQTNPAPQAEHLPPAALGAGASLPLWTPERAPPEPREPNQIPPDFEKPRGKLLIFWGCG